MDIDSYRKLCTEHMSESDIKACCMGVGAYGRGETIWVSAVSNDSSLVNMAKFLLVLAWIKLVKKSILDAQKQDQVVGRLLEFLKTGRWLKSWGIKR